MSLLQFPDPLASKNLQIWNNVAFDDADAGAGTDDGAFPLRPLSTNLPAGSSEIDPVKENRSPGGFRASPLVSKKTAPSPAPPKPSFRKPAPKKSSRVVAFKEELKVDEDDGDGGDGNVDDEIERVKKEIALLSTRLEALQLKKAANDPKDSQTGKRGRIIPAKFMYTKQVLAKTPATPASKKIEVSPASAKFRRRGLSLGPLEIISTEAKVPDPKQSLAKNLKLSASRTIEEKIPANRKIRQRGVSLGPLEIYGVNRSGKVDDPNGTAIRMLQSSKKTSFPKLEGIEESKGLRKETEKGCSPKSLSSLATKYTNFGAKVTNISIKASMHHRGLSLGPCEIAINAHPLETKKLQEINKKGKKVPKRSRSCSTSPKPRQPSSAKVSDMRKGIATMEAKKTVKREDHLLLSIRPKALFRDKINTVDCNGPIKCSKTKTVASRYSLAPTRPAARDEPETQRRKWSLPELDIEETNGSPEKPSVSMPESMKSQESETRDRMDTQHVSGDFDKQESYSPSAEKSPITNLSIELPMIRTFRCKADTPRDSGCAKRVAELVGRKPFFAPGEDEEPISPSQVLVFPEED